MHRTTFSLVQKAMRDFLQSNSGFNKVFFQIDLFNYDNILAPKKQNSIQPRFRIARWPAPSVCSTKYWATCSSLRKRCDLQVSSATARGHVPKYRSGGCGARAPPAADNGHLSCADMKFSSCPQKVENSACAAAEASTAQSPWGQAGNQPTTGKGSNNFFDTNKLRLRWWYETKMCETCLWKIYSQKTAVQNNTRILGYPVLYTHRNFMPFGASRPHSAATNIFGNEEGLSLTQNGYVYLPAQGHPFANRLKVFLETAILL